MALPNVKVNVGEETISTSNTLIPFVPVVIMKTKSGPIGTVETITSEAGFKAKFGESDKTTPSAFAIQKYLRTYSYVLVTRVANESAAKQGTATLKANMNLIKITTDYKTDLFNGKEVKLVYDGDIHKIWLDLSALTGKTTLSIKEDFTADTAKADVLEAALNKLVNSVNASNLGITMENLFINKTEEDEVPTLEQFQLGFSAYVAEGDSGNTTNVDVDKVKSLIDLYDGQDKDIDVMIIPEYTNYEVVNYAIDLAKKNNFVFLASPAAETPEECIAAISNYTPDTKGTLVLYFPNVRYSDLDADIPASIAALTAYAKNDSASKWGAPAGVTRGTLSLVSELTVKLTEEQMTSLYDNTPAINCINNISGKGFVIWGNKTASTDTEFFDRINVARLVKYVTRKVFLISYDYLFEPITTATFVSWQNRVESLLSTIKTGNGVVDYQVIMDASINTEETIAKNELNGIVKIKPQEVAEFITIDFTVTDEIAAVVEV